MLRLKHEQIIGIGDQENDLALIQNAGFGVAMGNSIETVKEAADFVPRSNDDYGVAYVVRKFVLTHS